MQNHKDQVDRSAYTVTFASDCRLVLTRISHQPRLPWMRGAKRGAIVVYAPCFGNAAGTVRSVGLW